MDFNDLTPIELAVSNVKTKQSLLYFTRFWFKVLRGSKFLLNWHHKLICNELEKTSN